MSEWKEYFLEECIKEIIDNRGKSAPTKSIGKYPLLEINSIGGYYPNYKVIRKYVDESTYNNWFRSGHPQAGDILIPTVGTIGIVSMMDNTKACIAQNLIALRIKESISNLFIYYFLKDNDVKKQLLNLDIGGVQPSIKVPHLKKLKILLPPKKIQDKISLILKSLDDKIENNRRVSENLEQQAQMLFKSWFVDFEPFKDGEFVESELGMIPKGWRIGTLNEILVLQKNNIKRGADATLPYLPIDIIPMHSLGITEFKDNSEAQSSLQTFEKDEIIVGAMRVYFHRVVIAPCKGITRNTCFVLKPKNIDMWAYSILLCNQDEAIDYANRTSKGSTMPYAVWDNGFGNYKIIIPKLDLLRRFNNLLYPFLEKLRDSYKENLVLSNIRDTLLPKLMSGELRVPDTDLIDEMLEKGIR